MPERSAGTFEILALELAKAVEPMSGRLHHEAALGLFAELGLYVRQDEISPALMNAINNAHTLGHGLKSLIDDMTQAIAAEDINKIIGSTTALVQHISLTLDSIKTISTEIRNLTSLTTATTENVNEFSDRFLERVTNMLISDYIETNYPMLFNTLVLFGIIEKQWFNEESTDPFVPSFERKTIHFDHVGHMFKNPCKLAEDTYKWGDTSFNGNLLLERFADLLEGLGIPVMREFLKDGTKRIALEIFLCSIQMSSDSKPGIEAILTTKLGDGYQLIIPVYENWDLHLSFSSSLEASAGLQLLPPANINVLSSASVNGDFVFKLVRTSTPDKPITILGLFGSSGISAKEISFGILSSFAWNSSLSKAEGMLGFEGQISGGKIKISTEGSDGFIAKILSGVNIDSDFNLGFGWRSGNGFYFTGSSSLEIKIPTHVNLGLAELKNITLGIGIKEDRFPATFTTDLLLNLGPLRVAVQEIGAQIDFRISSSRDGALGPLDLDLAFKPPTGVGLSVDAGGIKGGGILDFNPEKKEYFGALELEFQNWFSLKAFGIINTQLPDGSKGFSLLIIITAEFSPIQLGYGFTLNGVGGLMGVNRTTKVEVLKEGLKTNTLKSILFPEDIVANINRIVSDIKQVFPPQNGRFLICPMGKIGWGASIVTLEAGILIEIPVTDIKILGVLKVVLPNDKEPLLKLQVNFLGIIDFENKLISFDAFHYDSRVLTFTITGQMALRIDFRNDVFIISSGGFHPAFKEIPDDLTNMERITISLYDGENARIISQNYFAITSNTIQYGLKAELFAGSSSGFNIYGHISFDIIFKDIDEFIADFGAGVALRRGTSVIMGINVSGHFTGLSPLDIRGEASVSFFFFSVSVPFHVQIGNPIVELAKALAHLIQILKDEINDDRNWLPKLPANNKLHVTTRTITLGDSIAVHPFGILCFSERIVPLEIEIKKFGYQLPKDANKFQVKINDSDLQTEDEKEQFAPANFFEMTDEEKLSRPSFEQMKSGFKITGSAQLKAAPHVVKKPVDYEFSYLGKKKKAKPDQYIYPGNFFKANTKSAATCQSSLSHQNNRVSMNAPELVEVIKDRYVIANISDMKLHNDKSVADSYTEALQQYNNLILEKPELKGQIQLLAEYELN